MQVLWILYNTVGSSGLYVGNGLTQGGGWIDATMKELLSENNVHLTVAAIANQDHRAKSDEGVVYYGLGKIKRAIGGRKANKNEVMLWQDLLNQTKPDIIQVWGTEFCNGLNIALAAQKCKIPILYYIQGIAGAIAQYPNGAIGKSEYRKYIPLLSRWKQKRDAAFQKRLEQQAELERKMTALSDGVILDNDWAAAYFDGTPIYCHSLPVHHAFTDTKHRDGQAQEYSIVCCAGRGPHKGLHVLIKALPLIKKAYPAVKVYIPGNMNCRTPKWLFEPAYITYINKLIDRLGVRENIVFCGQLTPEQMAERMNASQIFVLPSCIENHSSTLREAMYLGLPCITTMVGSVHEFVQHRENGLIFRYAEHEQLAQQVKYLFASPSERERLGENAYRSIREKFPQAQTNVIRSVYAQALERSKKT